MAKRPSSKETRLFFYGAIEYQIAANRLLETMRAESLPLRDPTHLLYHHAVELALKACLLASGLSIPIGRAGREITGLYADCRDNGLLGDNEYYDIHNLIALLESGNFGPRSRYAADPNKDSMSDLDRLQGAVAMLISNVKPQVSAWAESHGAKPPTFSNHFKRFHMDIVEISQRMAMEGEIERWRERCDASEESRGTEDD